MLISRLVPLAVKRSSGAFKPGKGVSSAVFQQQKMLISTTIARHGGGAWAYRSMPKAEKKYETIAEVAGAFMWWWIFWHLMTDYHHLIGHYKMHDVDAWTDEELGIPPDDADDPE